MEDFQWLIKEIVQLGGEASLCEASFIEGLADEQIIVLFNTARDADYVQIAKEARQLLKIHPPDKTIPEDEKSQLRSQVERLQRRLAEVAALDFFGAPAREVAEGLVTGLEELLQEKASTPASPPEKLSLEDCRGRTWVTRRGIQVDRIASAWLIRRFIDPEANFKFVTAKGYQSQAGELRFDMFDGEFTHEGDRCSFEVLQDRLGLADPALKPIAEIIHDLDMKDSKYRPAGDCWPRSPVNRYDSRHCRRCSPVRARGSHVRLPVRILPPSWSLCRRLIYDDAEETKSLSKI